MTRRKPTTPTGTCGFCLRDDIALRANGTLRAHGYSVDRSDGPPCEGSGSEPAPAKERD